MGTVIGCMATAEYDAQSDKATITITMTGVGLLLGNSANEVDKKDFVTGIASHLVAEAAREGDYLNEPGSDIE